MNNYLVRIPKYFGMDVEYVIEATDKAEALEKAKAKSRREGGGNQRTEEARVVKKIKPSK